MKKETLIASVIAYSMLANGQETPTAVSSDQSRKQNDVVVNMKILKNFHEYDTNRTYIGFFDVFKELDGAEKIEFLRQYRITGFDKVSYLDIRNKVYHKIDSVKLTEADIEHFCAIKRAIGNTKMNDSLAKF